MALPAQQHLPGDEIGGDVRWTPEGYAALEAMAAARGVTPARVVQEALDLLLWADTVLADGGSIVARPQRGPWEVIRSRRR